MALLKSDFCHRYNPIKEYFENLPKWEEPYVDHIAQLAACVKASDQEQFAYHLKKWLVRTVKCAIHENYFNKQALDLLKYSSAFIVDVDAFKFYTTICVMVDLLSHISNLSAIVEASTEYKFKLERNAVSNNLQYRRGDDIKVLIIARAIIKGQKTEFKIGEEGGYVCKLNYTGHEVIALDDLRRKAQTDYDTKRADGFDGSFTAFGIPSVHHGEKVDLESRLYTDRNGVYYIEGVNKTFSKEGYRQEIKLGGRVSL